MNKGIILMIVFWLVGWFFATGLLLPSTLLRTRNDIEATQIVGPLTVTERILLGYKLKVNELSEKEWEALPGIGPSVAKKIIEYKVQHGPYPNLDSLMEVRGVGPQTIEAIRQFFDTPNL